MNAAPPAKSAARPRSKATPWSLRIHTLQRLMAGLALGLLVAINLHFYNRTTRKFKDCSVAWDPWMQERQLRIALVTMSTGGSKAGGGGGGAAAAAGGSGAAGSGAGSGSGSGTDARASQFTGLLELTRPNKEAYAKVHGYHYIDGSDLMDASRPASWSKLLAVLHHLPNYDWVFWIDADTVITNATIPMEWFIPAGERLDFIATLDSTGINAGVWLVRSSAWATSFLQRWWDSKEFVRAMGDTKSGDNDALKHIIATMDELELASHVGIAPQCAFNSYLWRPSLRNWLRYLRNPHHVLTGLWQSGDFLMHPAGVHHKGSALHAFMRAHKLLPSQQQRQRHVRGSGLRHGHGAGDGAGAGDDGAHSGLAGLHLHKLVGRQERVKPAPGGGGGGGSSGHVLHATGSGGAAVAQVLPGRVGAAGAGGSGGGHGLDGAAVRKATGGHGAAAVASSVVDATRTKRVDAVAAAAGLGGLGGAGADAAVAADGGGSVAGSISADAAGQGQGQAHDRDGGSLLAAAVEGVEAQAAAGEAAGGEAASLKAQSASHAGDAVGDHNAVG